MKLTEYAHGGGCGCKISPEVLNEILSTLTPIPSTKLLVGFESSDDAAVYKIDEETAIVATTDFFTPIVDDPNAFGRIAATNAFSDVYAMGAEPIFALGIVGMPIDKLPSEVVSAILNGGRSVCAELGVPLAGGHSIDTPEPIYGLVVIGKVDPSKVKTNDGASDGDAIILTKPLGIGVYSSALKKGILSTEDYQELLGITTQVNKPGAKLADIQGVHALTDVTGFGLLGHLREITINSSVGAKIQFNLIPLMKRALEFAETGAITGASQKNWSSYNDHIELHPEISVSKRALLSDPQTSGGLLITCDRSISTEVVRTLRCDGFINAVQIGEIRKDLNHISVEV